MFQPALQPAQEDPDARALGGFLGESGRECRVREGGFRFLAVNIHAVSTNGDRSARCTSALPPIAIVGAGRSGLTLGLCLKHGGIAAVEYERATSSPRDNYGIVVHSSTCRPLLSILHMDETMFRDKLAVNTQQVGSGSVLGANTSVPTDTFSLSPWPA